jgi:predicted membrane protein
MEILGFITGIVAAIVVCVIFNKKPLRIITTILAFYIIFFQWFNHNGNYAFTAEQTDSSTLLLYLECATELFVFSFPVIRGMFGYAHFMDKANENTKQSLKFMGKLIHVFFR